MKQSSWKFAFGSRIVVLFSMATLAGFVISPAICLSQEPKLIDFNRQIRPILTANCIVCHGPDSDTDETDLRLDRGESAHDSGAIVAGKPLESELIARITSDAPEMVMPPPDSKKALTKGQIELLRLWIQQGGKYDEHWALVPPSRPHIPQVKKRDWAKNPLDHFVLSRLEQAGLHPSAEADRYTLIRRVSLDLIGLPPTPEEADAFVKDSRPDAYERLVDRLLNSKHYGERWGRAWLDLARYSDTNGYEKDQPRVMWPYRDWVINAINADMPFDQFTVEQIAGDMLPGATSKQLIATGFHRNTMINEEGGIDPMEYRFYAQIDRVATTGAVWMGMTFGCTQCHSHKYDPLQHSEFYKMMSIYDQADDLEYDVPNAEIAKKRDEIDAQIAAIQADLANRFQVPQPLDWSQPTIAKFASVGGASLEKRDDHSVLVTGEQPERDTYRVVLEMPETKLRVLRLEALADKLLPGGGPGRAENGNFVITELSIAAAPLASEAEPQPVAIERAEADFSQEKFPIAYAVDGDDKTGWAIRAAADKPSNVNRTAKFHFKEPVGFEGGTRLIVTIKQEHGARHTLGRFRLSVGRRHEFKESLAVRRKAFLQQEFAAWLKQESAKAAEWKILKPTKLVSTLPILTVLDDQSVLASGDYHKSETFDVTCQPEPQTITAIRLETIPHESLPNNGPGRGSISASIEQKGRFFLSDFSLSLNGKKVPVASATESFAHEKSTAAKAIDENLQSGWANNGSQGRGISAVFQLAEPLSVTAGSKVTFHLHTEAFYPSGLGRFRLSVTGDNVPVVATGHPVDVEAILNKSAETRSETEQEKLLQRFLAVAPQLKSEHDKLEKMRRDKPRFTRTFVIKQRDQEHYRRTRRHHRGEYMNPREPVEPGVFGALHDLPDDTPVDRLTLARWLVSSDNPLVGRVTMNRDWAALFGRGLVRTVDDFGVQGERPTHPQLLDWLAFEFVNRGWSKKHMHRLMVTSATYRQSSRVNEELLERDPKNELLARGPRYRLDAELIRDAVLKVSGLMSEKIGGPSVFPPQPPGITEGAYGKLVWTVGTGESRYRRGLYTFNKRTAPYAMFSTFDGPSGELCVAARGRSNTPLQALMLLNDEVVVEAAQALAVKTMDSKNVDAESRAREMFRRCVIRPPEKAELATVVDFYQAQKERFRSGKLDAAAMTGQKKEGAGQKDLHDLAAWTAVARVLLNLDETITKD